MIVGIIRIILPGIILRDDGVCSQVKEQAGILPDDPEELPWGRISKTSH